MHAWAVPQKLVHAVMRVSVGQQGKEILDVKARKKASFTGACHNNIMRMKWTRRKISNTACAGSIVYTHTG